MYIKCTICTKYMSTPTITLHVQIKSLYSFESENLFNLKGHGHNFGKIIFFCFYFLHCFRNALVMIYQNYSVSLRVISETHFFVL